jgi:ribulose bisphosphate carboxylase small subunit
LIDDRSNRQGKAITMKGFITPLLSLILVAMLGALALGDTVQVGRRRFYTDPSQVPLVPGRVVTIDAGTYDLTNKQSIWLNAKAQGMKFIGRGTNVTQPDGSVKREPTVILNFGWKSWTPYVISSDARDIEWRDVKFVSTYTGSDVSENMYAFELKNDAKYVRLVNVDAVLMGLLVSYGADDVTMIDCDTGVSRGYGVFTGGGRNERHYSFNCTGDGSWDLHTRRCHALYDSVFENCRFWFDSSKAHHGWQGEGLKLVDGGNVTIKNCDLSQAPRMVIGPLIIPSDANHFLKGVTIVNSKLPYLNLYSGASDVRIEGCTIKGGEFKPSSYGRAPASATFVNDTIERVPTGATLNAKYLNTLVAGKWISKTATPPMSQPTTQRGPILTPTTAPTTQP